jgi:hypothetical protein
VNSREALLALLDGKKVRYYKWDKSEYIEMEKESTSLTDEKGDIQAWNLECYDCSGWELYEEPSVRLTPEDVGKRVRLENGDIVLLTWCNKDGSEFASVSSVYGRDGKDLSHVEKCSVKEVLK